MELELGNCGSGNRGTLFGGEPATSAAAAGGEQGGIEEGGEIEATSRDVMSTDGERRRLPAEEWELGEGESSGGGTAGGGRMKWKVRDAICICDLRRTDEGNTTLLTTVVLTCHLEGPDCHCLTRPRRPKRHSCQERRERNALRLHHTQSVRADGTRS